MVSVDYELLSKEIYDFLVLASSALYGIAILWSSVCLSSFGILIWMRRGKEMPGGKNDCMIVFFSLIFCSSTDEKFGY